MRTREDLETIAQSAMNIDLTEWVELVTNTISEFKNDTKAHTVSITPAQKLVSFSKETTYGLIQLHFLAIYCPAERVHQFIRLLIDHDIDKGDMSGIFSRLVASLLSHNR